MVGLEQEPLLERHLQPLVHRLEGEAHGQGTHRQYTPQRFLRRGQQLRARHHLVHEADPVRFVGVDHVARQNEVQGVPLAHETRQALRAAITGRDAELHLRLTELCGLTRDPEMARHGELAPPAQGIPVHGGDDRLAAGLEAAQHRLATLRPRLAVERALLREIRDVGPRDEGFGAGAREDGTPDRRLRRHALRGVGQLVHHLVVQRVELVGPVDGDARDGVTDLEEEGLVAHQKKLRAECGVRNAVFQGKVDLRSDRSLTLRTPHPALRTRNYRTNKLPDPLFPSLAAVTSDDPDRSARITTDSPATASTRATVESLTDQATGRPERMFPRASRSVAKNLAVSPAATT